LALHNVWRRSNGQAKPRPARGELRRRHLLTAFATRKGATPAQIALAWLPAQRPYIVPIPGGTALEHLDDNLPAADIELSDADLSEIDQVFSTIDVTGAPLSEALDSQVQR
jgi:aryl-alcohol dehydrogenase-like predicted oxidoreductase